MKKPVSILIAAVLILSLGLSSALDFRGILPEALPFGSDALRTMLRYLEQLKAGPGAAFPAGVPETALIPLPDQVENGYTVFICDEEGLPVPGVRVQLCPGASCIMKKTADNGVALFGNVAPGVHEFHLLRLPDGYEAVSDIPEKTSAEETVIRITLRKVN